MAPAATGAELSPAAAKLLDVRPETERFSMIAHSRRESALVRYAGLIDLAGLRETLATGPIFVVAWSPDLTVVPAAGAAEAPWRWGFAETAISALHHVVYAAVGEGRVPSAEPGLTGALREACWSGGGCALPVGLLGTLRRKWRTACPVERLIRLTSIDVEPRRQIVAAGRQPEGCPAARRAVGSS